tara:strand:+ start:105 stop:467 length:363 start_codon:yes stop_codon:yes gene_type:complete
MNLLVRAELSSKPRSEELYFRFLSMSAKQDLGYCVLLESEKNEVDDYYNLLKSKGCYDFVEEIVLPDWRVEGVRIDLENNYPFTIKAQYIKYENVLNLLGQLKSFKGLFGNNNAFDFHIG